MAIARNKLQTAVRNLNEVQKKLPTIFYQQQRNMGFTKKKKKTCRVEGSFLL